jgi:hypothetical protein
VREQAALGYGNSIGAAAAGGGMGCVAHVEDLKRVKKSGEERDILGRGVAKKQRRSGEV